MIKTTLYPKTKRVGSVNKKTVITEKLDGSNIGFFKHQDELWIAQRNNVFSFGDVLRGDLPLYKGLFGWLEENGEELEEQLQPTAMIFGEWIGMGRLSYGQDFGRFRQFAKCNVEDYAIKNLYYDHELFKWSFIAQEQPPFIQSVPIVETVDTPMSTWDLDLLYTAYCTDLERDCEGFIVNTNNTITKYVRMKNGTLTPHKS